MRNNFIVLLWALFFLICDDPLTQAARAQAAALGAVAAAGTVTNGQGVGFSQAEYVVQEGAGAAVLTVARSDATAQAFTVVYMTEAISATAAADYTPVSGTLSFAQGELSKTISIRILDDAQVEGDERIKVTLGIPSDNIPAGVVTTALVTIRDNEAAAPLLVDPSFHSDSFLAPTFGNLTVARILLQADGEILLTGAFLLLSGTNTAVARFKTDGTPDDSFRARIGYGGSSNTLGAYVFAAAIQPDGKIVVGGRLTSANGAGRLGMARLNSDGTLDTSFDSGNLEDGSETGRILALALDPNGNVIAGGRYDKIQGVTRPGLARVSAAGLLDSAFVPAIAPGATVSAVALQPERKLLAAVNEKLSGIGKGIVRLNANGSLDTTFDTGPGGLINRIKGGDVTSMQILPDGRILVAGDFTSLGGLPRFGIARLLPDGSVDPAFDAGTVAIDQEGTGSVRAMTLQPDGAILIAGYGGLAASLGRLDSSGKLDPTFAVSPGIGSCPGCFAGAHALALQADGKIVVGGVFTGGPALGGLVRLQSSPTNSIGFATGGYSVKESDGTATLTVRRFGESSGPAAVDYRTRNGTATAGLDYVGQQGTLSFGALETTKTVSITLLNDPEAEPEETFSVELLNPSVGAALGNLREAVVKLAPSDGGFELDVAGALIFVNETEGALSVGVLRGSDLDQPVSVDYATADIGARAGQDYGAVSGSLTFGTDEVEKWIAIPILRDAQAEADEQFTLTLRNPSAGTTIGARATVNVSILDDYAGLRLGANAFWFQETTNAAVIPVVRERSLSKSVTVQYRTMDGTAHAGNDYTAVSGTLTFGPGETVKQVEVPLIKDGQAEALESFQFVLENPSQDAQLTYPQTAVVNLQDEGFLGSTFNFEHPDYVLSELDSNVQVMVVRSEPAQGTAYVKVSARPGTATPGLDYGVIESQLFFGNGQARAAFFMTVNEDLVAEGDETFLLALSEPSSSSGPASLGTQSVALVTIQNAGNAVELANPMQLVSETSKVAAILVQRRGETNLPFTVKYATSNLNAVAGQDYTAQSGTLTFAEGQLTNGFTIPVFDNYRVDGTRGVQVTLTDLTGRAVLTSRGKGMLLITDDERPVAIDPSWRAALTPDSNPTAVVVQADGKIVLAGSLRTTPTAEWQALSRLNPDGSVDDAFKLDSAGGTGIYQIVALGLDPSGNVLAAAQNEFRLFRLTGNGTLDASFKNGLGAQGLIYLNGVSITVQTDGKIIVTGEHELTDPGRWSGLIRLNADGSVDPTFNAGQATVATYSWDPTRLFASVSTVAVQPDGKILVGGRFTSYNGVPVGGIARLNADGSLDPTFDPGSGVGFRIDWDPNRAAWVNSIAVLANGDIALGGSFNRVNGVERWLVARLHSDGSLDPNFDLRLNGDQVFLVQEQPNDQLLAAGNFGSPFGPSGLGRFGPNGIPDPTLNANVGGASTVHLLADGDLLVLGNLIQNDGMTPARLVHVFGDVTLHRGIGLSSPAYSVTEGGTNIVTLMRGGESSQPLTVKLTTQDETATAGLDYTAALQTVTLAPGENQKEIVIPILNDGLVEDTEFFSITLSEPSAGVLLNASSRARVEILDDEVNAALELAFAPEIDGQVSMTAYQPDGKILIAGSFNHVHGVERTGVARLHADGSLDLSFNAGPGFSYAGGACCGSIQTFTVQPDGRILVGGDFQEVQGAARARLARLLPDGSVDLTFTPPSELFSPASALVLQPEGKILVAGDLILRLNGDGSRDNTFKAAGDGGVQLMQMLTNGSIMVGGWFTQWEGQPRGHVARLKSDGSLDPTFAPPELTDTATGALLDRALAISTDGKTLLTGLANDAQGQQRAVLVLLNPDGTIASNFQTTAAGTQLNLGFINSALFEPGGALLIVSGGTVARLNPNGSVDPGTRYNLSQMSWWGGGAHLETEPSSGKTLASGWFYRSDGSNVALARLDLGNARSTKLTFSQREFGASETAPARISVRRIGDVSGSSVVKFVAEAEQGLTAFVPLTVTLTYSPLESEKIISIPLIDDAITNEDRRITLTLSDPTPGALLDLAQASVTIGDDETPGTIDFGFDPSLAIAPENGSLVGVYTIQPLADGRVRVWGRFETVRGVRAEGYALLNDDGSLDIGDGQPSPPGSHFMTQFDGRVIDNQADKLFRRFGDGTPDPSFSLTFTPPWSVRTAVQQADGKIVIAGSFSTINGSAVRSIARVNPDGTLDTNFAHDAGPYQTPGGSDIRVLLLQPDGRMLVGGSFSAFNQVPRDSLARLNADGTLDPTFNPHPLEPIHVQSSIASAILQPDGKVLVLGWLSWRAPQGRQEIIRLNSDGTVDLTFPYIGPAWNGQQGGWYEGSLYTMAVGADGDLYVGGEFSRLGKADRAGIVRISLGLPAPVQIESVGTTEQGEFVVAFQSAPGQKYRVETSDDLVEWSFLREVTATSAQSEFREQTAKQAHRFYRVQSP
jgi:uncharacterized delta-60 repeat protein